MDKLQAARELRRALELFVQTLTEDEIIMEVPSLYPMWQAQNARYLVGTIIQYGVNKDGEPQLYRVAQEHTSQAGWTPDQVPAMFTKIGFTPSGVPIWTQPLGAHDAYNKGDIVMHNDKKWESVTDGNVWEPGVHGWTVVP